MILIEKKLERVQLTDTIKLIMPEKVLNQIKYLCKEIPKVEWSGVLYYSTKGSIKDPANMVLTLEEILPLHKGTPSYTEYEFGTAFVEHMMDNEYLEKCKIGHIHSHNTMGVFFSGTDWSELEDNSHNHNFYLSLIVNNFMDFTAKVGFIVESTGTQKFDFTAKDENGKKYIFDKKDYTVKDKKFITYDCDIISPLSEIIISDNFKKKVKTIIEDSEKNNKTVYTQRNIPKNDWYNTNYSIPDTKKDKKYEEDIEDTIDDNIEEFTMLVLNMGNDIEDYNDIIDIIKVYKQYAIDNKTIVDGVLSRYIQLYESFFQELSINNDIIMFAYITEQVISILKEERDYSILQNIEKILDPIIEGLTGILNNFKKI